MVLIRRKQVELVKPPIQVEGQDPDVFYLAATGEIFSDYESYTSRLSFYNQRLFQCELTGKIGLTFFEASLSENQELARLIRDFPEVLKGPILTSANFAVVGRLDQLVDQIYERFHNRFFPGDEVSIEIDGEKHQAEVKEVYPPRSVWRVHQEAVVESKLKELAAQRRSMSASPKKARRSPVKASASRSMEVQNGNDSDSDLSDLTELPPASQEQADLAGIAEAAALSLSATDVAHKLGCDLATPMEKAVRLDPPEDYLYRLQLKPNAHSSIFDSDEDDDEDEDDEERISRRKNTSFSASSYEARASALSRDRLKFSKTILKKLLREALRRDPRIGAPWTVRENWARVHGIDLVPSEAIARKNQELREAKLQKRKKVCREKFGCRMGGRNDSALTFRFWLDQIVEEVVPEPPKKRKKASAKVSAAALKRKAAEEARLAKEKEEEEKRLKAERKKLLRYPCEDLELDPIHGRELSAHVPGEVPRSKVRPAPKRELPGGVSGRVWEDFLAVYGYLQAAGKALQLSPFTLDDFEAALKHPTHEPQCTLLVEIHAAVLNTLIRDNTLAKDLAPAALSVVAPQAAASGSGQRVASIKREELGEEGSTNSRSGSVPNGRASREGSSAAVGAGAAAKSEPHANGAVAESFSNTRNGLSGGRKASSNLTNGAGKANGQAAADVSVASAVAGDGDFLDMTPEEQVLSNALHAGRGWEKRILKQDEGRKGWEVALVGCLAQRATEVSVPRLWGILSHLTGTDHPDGRSEGPRGTFLGETYPDEVSRYPVMPFEDKIAALQFVCELSMMTKYARAFFEECENALTELRKERPDISRARKQNEEERRELAAREAAREENAEANGEASAEPKPETEAEAEAGPASPMSEAERPDTATTEADDQIDELDEDSDDSGSDFDGASATSSSDLPSKRPRLASRQETLRKQALEREAAEQAKEAERARAAQAKKDKNAEARQLAAERRRLDDELAKVIKREEAWERDFRKHQFGPRLKPLGYDRFYQRYWWMDGLGNAPLINQAGNVVYSTGRIFVQGPSADEWSFALIDYPEAEVRARAEEELGEDGLLGEGEWGYYDDAESAEQLFAWLRVRGQREDKFKKEFTKWRHYIVSGMRRRVENLSSASRPDAAEGRRSVRTKTEASRQTHMLWRNKEAVR
ncbi:hypothetical protein OC845_002944 [Tilletia horrida]|nr:hypothetical protein OC845_002944 [Tilletia horrida]